MLVYNLQNGCTREIDGALPQMFLIFLLYCFVFLYMYTSQEPDNWLFEDPESMNKLKGKESLNFVNNFSREL